MYLLLKLVIFHCYLTLLEVKTGITFRVFLRACPKFDVSLQWKHLRDNHHDIFWETPNGWWLNQPICKICSSNWIISPWGENIFFWNHHLAYCFSDFHWPAAMIITQLLRSWKLAPLPHPKNFLMICRLRTSSLFSAPNVLEIAQKVDGMLTYNSKYSTVSTNIFRLPSDLSGPLPETNSSHLKLDHWWLEDKPFLLGRSIFRCVPC